ncbi:MAG: AAA family ATPase [Azospirillaceae bacterium]
MTRRFVLTGAPGSGKSSVLAALAADGVATVAEPARQVLAQQRATGGDGVPDRDPGRFVDLMLARAVSAYDAAAGKSPVIFDRGVPDLFAYAEWYGLDTAAIAEAAARCRYEAPVFVAPDWPAIYRTDDERTMRFEEACRFGDSLRRAYRHCGYDLVDLPRADVATRSRFILERVGR